jgi:hypothetical protein
MQLNHRTPRRASVFDIDIDWHDLTAEAAVQAAAKNALTRLHAANIRGEHGLLWGLTDALNQQGELLGSDYLVTRGGHHVAIVHRDGRGLVALFHVEEGGHHA